MVIISLSLSAFSRLSCGLAALALARWPAWTRSRVRDARAADEGGGLAMWRSVDGRDALRACARARHGRTHTLVRHVARPLAHSLARLLTGAFAGSLAGWLAGFALLHPVFVFARVVARGGWWLLSSCGASLRCSDTSSCLRQVQQGRQCWPVRCAVQRWRLFSWRNLGPASFLRRRCFSSLLESAHTARHFFFHFLVLFFFSFSLSFSLLTLLASADGVFLAFLVFVHTYMGIKED